jgi:MFS family permease
MSALSSRRRLAILATVSLAVFAINLDTTIVNVALPDLARELGATTRDLQWIVDGYNLAFAALVLTAGSIGDRFGRRPALLVGLAGFAVASAIGALVTGAGALVVVRLVMGAFAALTTPRPCRSSPTPSPTGPSAPRRSACGARSPASASRSDRSPAGCCWPTSGGAASSSRWCPWPSAPLRSRTWSCPNRVIRAKRASTCPD